MASLNVYVYGCRLYIVESPSTKIFNVTLGINYTEVDKNALRIQLSQQLPKIANKSLAFFVHLAILHNIHSSERLS